MSFLDGFWFWLGRLAAELAVVVLVFALLLVCVVLEGWAKRGKR